MGNYKEKVKVKIGEDVWNILRECAEHGNISASQMKDLAYELNPKVGGNHMNRREQGGNKTGWDELCLVLGDWYKLELGQTGTKDALEKLVRVFNGEVRLPNIAGKIEKVLVSSSGQTKCVHTDFFNKVKYVLLPALLSHFAHSTNIVFDEEAIDIFLHLDDWINTHANLTEVLTRNPTHLISSLTTIIAHDLAK